jgi:integrase
MTTRLQIGLLNQRCLSKDAANHDLNKKRYLSSRGIVIPEKNYYQLPYGANEYEAFSHVMQLAADHNNDGMTFFSNQALGVCWVATAPID